MGAFHHPVRTNLCTAARSIAGIAMAALVGACAVGPVSADAEPAPPTLESDGTTLAGPAIRPSGATDLAGPQRLDALIRVLLAQNPSVAAARARLEAAAERKPQVTALPDPEVEAKWFVRNAMAPRDAGFTRWELMVSQSFPMPQMLALRGDAADAATRMAAFRYEATVRDAIAALEDVHAERRYLAGAEAVQTKLEAVYRRYADVARAGMDSGAARLPESFRAEALAAQSSYDLRLLREMRGVEDAKLRALLGVPGSAPVGPPADAPAVRVLDTSNDQLVARAMEWNQDLRGAGVEVEMAAIDSRMARWNRAPMFMVGVGKMFNDDYDMETGKTTDGATLSFGMTLPIWQHALSAGEREADAKARAAVADEQQMRTMVAADVAMTAFQARATQRLADLYSKTLVPQAELAMSAADARVRKGEESLASSLELAAAWQQMNIARLRAEADHVKAIAALEKLLGTTLTATNAEAPR
ncbi:MAG: TolC family protein [Planctomycetes bacterium]|nr:TolC family protein [Planctomycetota bacterium]